MKKQLFVAGLVLVGLVAGGFALADNIYDNLDGTIDATLEVMNLTVPGPTGSTSMRVDATNGDGKNGCNLTGATTLVVSVNSSNTGVATVSPSTLTFTGCGNVLPVTVTPVGTGSATVSLSLVSNSTAGTFNLAPASFTVNVTPAVPVDTTAPVISVLATPAANGAGWNNSDVTVIWTVNDPESAITSSSGCETTVLTNETTGTTLTCMATSAGGTSSKSVTIKIDKTKPVITGSRLPVANANGWNNTDVTASFVCAETGTVQSGIATNTVAGATVSTEGAGQSVTNTGACTDVAGNTADSATVTDINIDKTAPVVTIMTPANSGSYTFHSNTLANWSATDALSDIDTATGTVANGAQIDVSSLGAKSFTVTATDLAGNMTTVTNSYTVLPYDFRKCYPPLTLDSKDFKKSSTIPTKCAIVDTVGAPITNAVVQLYVDSTAAVSSGASNTANYFRYSPTDMFWIYNLSTKMPVLTIGTHTLRIATDDGANHYYTVKIK